jgi:hypothetical protein
MNIKIILKKIWNIAKYPIVGTGIWIWYFSCIVGADQILGIDSKEFPHGIDFLYGLIFMGLQIGFVFGVAELIIVIRDWWDSL